MAVCKYMLDMCVHNIIIINRNLNNTGANTHFYWEILFCFVFIKIYRYLLPRFESQK